jgi:hypothetical protein
MASVETDQEKQDAQKAVEERLIANVRVCSVPDTQGLDSVNPKIVASKLERDFYSASLVEALACYFDVTLHADSKRRGIVPAPSHLHNNLVRAHKIGAESVEGVALLTGISGGEDEADDLVVIKAPQKPTSDGLVHEYFVALACLNPLRRRVPGFMYAFGAFRCSAPVLDGKTVVEWCTPKGPSVNYVVFEKVTGGKSVHDVMPDLSLDQFISYYIQVALNERVAVEACSWTHYDLHDENVLVREIEEAKGQWFYVPFVLGGDQVVYVKSDRIPTFIDYGRAHVKYQDRHFGFFDSGLMESDGLFPDQCRPLYDMYKLLGFALYGLLKEGGGFVSRNAERLFRALMPLFAFFRDVPDYPTYLAAVKSERDSFYVYEVEISDVERQSSIQDLLSYIEEQYPEQWEAFVTTSIGPEDLVATCSGIVREKEDAPCSGTRQEIDELSVTPTKFGLTKGKHLTVEAKRPEELVTEVTNSRNRLKDIRNTRESAELNGSVEYRDVSESNARAERLLKERYDALRSELIARIREQVRQLTKESQLKAYDSGFDFDFEISKDARQNDASLRRLLEALEESHLNLIFALVKQYTVDRATLSQLEYTVKERSPTDQSQFLLPARLARAITRDVRQIETYLRGLKPLSREGRALRDAMLNTIDLGKRTSLGRPAAK